MATASISTDVKGLDETLAKLKKVSVAMKGRKMQVAMLKATLIVTRDAKKNTGRPLPAGPSVDTGRLRASITPQVVTTPTEVMGIVGSNVKYAAMQELGTRPFTPPWTPIFEWAKRKLKGDKKGAGGLTVVVRRAITKRGIKAKRFLQDALEKNAERIFRLLGDVVIKIVNE